MRSLCWRALGGVCLFLSLAFSACGSDSGGSTAKDASPGSGGAGTGGTIGGGAGGGAGAVDASRDVAVAQFDAGLDSTIQAVDTSQSAVDMATDAPIVTGVDGGVAFAQIKSLIAARCAACHTGTGSAASRIDFTDRPDAASTLYARLLAPLLLETYCGEALDAGGDAAHARRAIVPDDPGSSFLYLKITGTQPSPGNPPASCGVRMPRVIVPGVDGGAATQPSCEALDGGAAANCLGTVDIELVRQWILEGAPQ